MAVTKRRRSDAGSKKKESPLVREDATTAPQKSILESSEVSFPRGGASALTPLELKEVANEAASDVLFGKETTGAASAPTTLEEGRPLKKKKTSSKNIKNQESSDKPTIKVEALNFKSLHPGNSVLGQITEINRLDIALSLPNNLIGYVPITSISSIITKQLELFKESDSEDESEDEDNEEEDDESKVVKGTSGSKSKEFPILSKYFKVGQWLRAVVVESNLKGKKNQQKKRIQLSVEIEKANKDLEDDDLVPGSTLQAAVKSVEDHGLILDTGKEGLGGFISNKELKNANYDITKIIPGTVFLTTIVNKNARTVTVKLNTGKKNPVTTISSVDSIIPGNYIETLVTEVHQDGLITKSYGLVDSSINIAHLGTYSAEDIKHKYAVGSNIKARVIAVIVSNGSKKLVLSVLPHILNLNELNYDPETLSAPLEAFPLGHTFESVEVKGHDGNYIYVSVGGDRFGQVHTSRTDGGKSGLAATYTIGSKHKARVLGFSQFDNSYVLTMDPKIIEQKYLRAQDLPLGEKVNGDVISVSEAGLRIKIFKQYEAVVPAAHMSDVKLIYPERKFKIGSKVRGRIINVSKYTSEITVTLKKSLVGIENVIASIDDAKVGERTSVTVASFKPSGALVSFFGNLKAFLPKSEISETFVKKPEDHLRLGQTVTVRIASVDKENHKISVSCRLSEESTEEQKQALDNLVVGRSILKVEIVEKSKESVIVEIPGNNLRGVIFEGHLSDGNFEQNRAILKRLEVGSTIEGLVLDKDARSRLFNLSAKKSLISAAQENQLPVSFNEISVSEKLIPGYIKSVTDRGIFVGFGAKLVGLVLAKYATSRPVDDLTSVFTVNQSVSVRVIRTDDQNQRFLLSLKEKKSSSDDLVNPVDESVKSVKEFVPGKVTKAVIKSVKQTQLNVQLADNVQGRIDVSQIFDKFDEIKDPKNPLAVFKKGEVLDVKVIGFHDARNHRFLPISHRRSKQILIELSAKKSDLSKGAYEPLAFNKLTVGTEWVAFINNSTIGFFFLNLSPSIKGRISFMDLPGEAAALQDLDGNYPIGSALKVKVKAVDVDNNAVLLTGRQDSISTIEDAKVGAVVPSRVLRITESFVIVELTENLTALSYITDALNDYSKKLEDVFDKNDIVPAEILEVDEHNKKLNVSLRSKNAKDRLISSSSDLKRGDVVHGFVKNISEKGLFIALGRTVTGYVRVSDVSDSFLKEWKKHFRPHQPVIGKIVKADDEGHVTLTLKESEVNGELNILKRFEDITVGEIFEGSVRRVTDFGVFIKLDGTLNISGLCHHSQISDNDVSDLGALFGEGDRVKVKILAVDSGKKQLSLGMKASFFSEGTEDNEEDVDMEDEDEVSEDESMEVDEEDEGVDEDDEDALVEDAFNEQESDSDDEDDSEDDRSTNGEQVTGLTTNGFDWTASILDQVQDDESSDEEDFTEIRNKKKRKTKEVVEDTTGDLQSKAPQSVSDFERLIIGNPNSSIVWMNYMSFQLQLSEIEKAREIAERALKTINYREEQEKMNIWIALLNLENTFGTEETLEDAFKRSTEYMDSLTMHQKLVSIYIISEKFSKADALFKVITKKFGRESVSVWVTYGSYLLDHGKSEKAHEVLASSLSSLPKRDHIEVVRKFAQLEFSKGDAEQGRTLFEGLIADVPKRIDLWNVYIDQEIKANANKKVSDLFERVLSRKVSRKQAKFFFGKWLAFEEKNGDAKAVDYVKAKAQEYVQKNKE